MNDDAVSLIVDDRIQNVELLNAYNDLRAHYQDQLEAEILRRSRELKTVYEEKENLERQLFQARKLEAIGRLAGGVAHDFNNILQVIQGYADHMLGTTPEGDLRRTWLQQILVASDKAAALVQSLLAFSLQKVQRKVVMNLNLAIQDIEPMLRELLGRKVRFRLEASPDLGDVEMDRTQIDQIFMNLAANARDAMPQGGSLDYRTTNVQIAAGLLELASEEPKPDSYVLLTVDDNGAGMDQATLEHIFEPFFTTKAIGKGTGLGLATVYGAVKQAGGYVSCASSPGNGTSFRILLPRVI